MFDDIWGDRAAPAKAKGSEGTAESAAQPATSEPTLPGCPARGERILLVGDSLAVGLGPHMKRHARACDNAFFTHGVVGSHVTEWVQPSWLAAELERAQPTVVMVSMGGNDFGRHDADRVAQGVERFVVEVRESGARLLWISPPTMPFADRIGVRRMWREAIGERNVDWFPTEELTIERVADRVHPTIAEYATLSETLWRWLAAHHLAEPARPTAAVRLSDGGQ